MVNRILLPLDGTEVGEEILQKVDDIILRNIPGDEVKISLLTVLPIVNFDVLTQDPRAQLPYTESDRNELFNNAYSYLEKVAEKLRNKGFTVNKMVKMGHTAEEIVKVANETNVNLIALSTHGRSSIIRWLTGSTTEDVIRLEEKIPVLTLHIEQKVGKHEKHLHLGQELASFLQQQ